MTLQPIWPMTPHTAAKHDILRGYLQAWFPILSTYAERLVFIDGFAGPGTYEGGEDGSPIVAIKALVQHRDFEEMTKRTEFVFMFSEPKPKRVRSLRAELQDFEAEMNGFPPKLKVYVRDRRFYDLAEGILDDVHRKGHKLAPTFAFVDPFGCKDVRMDQLSELLSHDRCELFIYFNFNFVNRWSSSGEVDQVLEGLYGTDRYRDAPPAGHPDRHRFLLDLYLEQLRTRANFRYIQPFRMINSAGITGHYMVFATRHIKGLKAMKHAMWKVAPSGDYQFSDRLAGQEVLFGEEENLAPLRAALLQHFAGRTVPIEEVVTWVLTDTLFLDTHVKVKTLRPMQKEGLIGAANQRKPGFYPDGTLIVFPPRI